MESQIWHPFVNKVYPVLLKSMNHDLLHNLFVKAARQDMLPKLEKTKEIKEVYKAKEGTTKSFFPTPVGLGSGVLREGMGIDSIFDMGELGYVEIGPVTIDP